MYMYVTVAIHMYTVPSPKRAHYGILAHPHFGLNFLLRSEIYRTLAKKGAPFIRPRLGDGPIFKVSVSQLRRERAPR